MCSIGKQHLCLIITTTYIGLSDKAQHTSGLLQSVLNFQTKLDNDLLSEASLTQNYNSKSSVQTFCVKSRLMLIFLYIFLSGQMYL